MKLSVRCVDGPYAGQGFHIPFHRTKLNYSPVISAYGIGSLVWIVYGTDKHCYQLFSNGWNGDWRLVYRDTF